ncbi:MAG: hypothetical protein AAF825_02815 [Pseudomonadota bacterium]
MQAFLWPILLIALSGALAFFVCLKMGPRAGWMALGVVVLMNLPAWLSFLAVVAPSVPVPVPADESFLPPVQSSPGFGGGAMGSVALGAATFSLLSVGAAVLGLALGRRARHRAQA